MQQCIDLAKIALQNGESPVGSVIIHQGKTIGRGIESGKACRDVTRHAEILAVRDAIQQGYGHLLGTASLYSTHEPCLMCSYVLRHHRIPRIIFGLAVPHIGGATSGFKVLQTEEVPNWGPVPEIILGVCREACLQLGK